MGAISSIRSRTLPLIEGALGEAPRYEGPTRQRDRLALGTVDPPRTATSGPLMRAARARAPRFQPRTVFPILPRQRRVVTPLSRIARSSSQAGTTRSLRARATLSPAVTGVSTWRRDGGVGLPPKKITGPACPQGLCCRGINGLPAGRTLKVRLEAAVGVRRWGWFEGFGLFGHSSLCC